MKQYFTSLVNDVINSLLQAITGSGATTGILKGATGNISGDLNLNNGFKDLVEPDVNNSTGNNPKAYLTMLFFDERFQFVGENSQSLRVSQGGVANASLTLQQVKAPKNGYCFVYVSNESGEVVYFDNFAFSIVHGNIIEENHYYSFGLKISAISSKKIGDSYEGKLGNSYQYNDKEMLDEDADLNWYDYGFRNYDPQIGRFMQLDPLTDDYPFLTPYQYASNDPITNIDIDGLEGGSAVGTAGDFVYDVGSNVMDIGLQMAIGLSIQSATVVAKGTSVMDGLVKITGYVIKSAMAATIISKSGQTKMVGDKVNVYIFFGGQGARDWDKIYNSDDKLMGQWHTISAYDVMDANNKLKRYLKGRKIDNLVLSSHGASGTLEIGAGGRSISNKVLDEHEKTKDLTDEQYDEWIKGKGTYYDARAKKGDIEEFSALLDKVKSGGNVVISGCNAGAGPDGQDLGERIVKERTFTLFLNQDQSTLSYQYDDPKKIHIPTGYARISKAGGRLTDGAVKNGWIKFSWDSSNKKLVVKKGKYEVIIGPTEGATPVQFKSVKP